MELRPSSSWKHSRWMARPEGVFFVDEKTVGSEFVTSSDESKVVGKMMI